MNDVTCKPVLVVPVGHSTNVALNKPVRQSTTAGSFTASFAVDGIIDQDHSVTRRCSSTLNFAATAWWWSVDLEDETVVRSVEIYGRNDELGEQRTHRRYPVW